MTDTLLCMARAEHVYGLMTRFPSLAHESTRETISTKLAELAHDGLIRFDDRTIVLVSPKR